MKEVRIFYPLLLLFIAFGCKQKQEQSQEPTQPGFQSFTLEEVKLLPGVFREAQQTDLKYILELEPDRLLAPYLREAGLQPKKESYAK